MNEKDVKRLELYVNGHPIRSLHVDQRHINRVARSVGISPRPMGFANYIIAHEWVLKARKEYDDFIRANYSQSQYNQSV